MKSGPIRINWEGSLFVHHSLGMVNRELLRELVLDRNLDIRHIPFEPDQFSYRDRPRYLPLEKILAAPHPDALIHVRHRWPPDLSRPAQGKHVLIQPWEYGSIPREWVESVGRTVDEIWVPSRFLKECYMSSGVPENRVQVVPNGVDTGQFTPASPPLPLIRERAAGRFCFLYNGGVTQRKGADILVNAYLNEFGADEPVCLVIKDSNAYGKEMSAAIEAFSKRNDIGRIIYSSEDISPENLPGLYTACDCYVQPYRGEGYGLPIAEAMACGLPTIVTGGGACLDFTDESTSWYVPCTKEFLPQKAIGAIETVDYPFWLVCDIPRLQQLMRFAFEHAGELRAKGEHACNKIRSGHTWKHAAHSARERILMLSGYNRDCCRF